MVAAGTAALAFRILRAGYGADNDTYLMLGTWDGWRTYGNYVPSRFQGSPLAEMVIGGLSWVGGHWLSGLFSLVLGLVSMVLLYQLVRSRSSAAMAMALTSMVAVAPGFVIAATTSHDYIYALALLLAGWWWWERGGSPEVVGLLFALSATARLSTIACGLVIIAFAPTTRARIRGRTRAAAVAVVVAAIAYVPGLLNPDPETGFFGATRPTGQGIKGTAARVLLKPPLFFGWFGTAAVLVAVLVVLRRRRMAAPATQSGDHWIALVMLIQVVLWLWLPVEVSYLLPAVAAAAVYFASLTRTVAVPAAARWVWVVVAFSGWLDVAPLTIIYADHGRCKAVEAIDARIEPRVESGQLLHYPDLERERADCNSLVRRQQMDDAKD